MQRTVPVLLAAAAIVVTAAGCSGGKNKSSSTTSTTTTTAASPGTSPAGSPAASPAMTPKNPTMGKPMAAVGNGSTIYNTNCSSCHQANGKGQPGAFPPLAGNSTVTGSPDKVIHIVKNGLTGKITVGSSTYNGQMPAWKGTLSDADIAHVVSYIRSSWGNHASAVTAAQVTFDKVKA